MLRRLEASHGHVIGYSLAGDVTAEEYQQATSELRDAIALHGQIRVLFRLEDLSLSSFLTSLDERFSFLQEHRDDIERIAVVSDDTATDVLSRLTGAVASVETRHFPRDKEREGWAWLE